MAENDTIATSTGWWIHDLLQRHDIAVSYFATSRPHRHRSYFDLLGGLSQSAGVSLKIISKAVCLGNWRYKPMLGSSTCSQVCNKENLAGPRSGCHNPLRLDLAMNTRSDSEALNRLEQNLGDLTSLRWSRDLLHPTP